MCLPRSAVRRRAALPLALASDQNLVILGLGFQADYSKVILLETPLLCYKTSDRYQNVRFVLLILNFIKIGLIHHLLKSNPGSALGHMWGDTQQYIFKTK